MARAVCRPGLFRRKHRPDTLRQSNIKIAAIEFYGTASPKLRERGEDMSPIVAYSLLLIAAMLEAAGDALARMGHHALGSASRPGWHVRFPAKQLPKMSCT
ncbi:hypothetical protein [Hyphomicrobium sp.]|uniref:hypothetical protein n=1 Tax=Hyphomicrobium sp. TaxID=82 RepID=UPI000F916156|nr:hypothetical protein [Hyphomicrobium sp.]RUP00369.1 MAG: hypothetical protein EKK30_02070 [Hyphomicrobium sp.]